MSNQVFFQICFHTEGIIDFEPQIRGFNVFTVCVSGKMQDFSLSLSAGATMIRIELNPRTLIRTNPENVGSGSAAGHSL